MSLAERWERTLSQLREQGRFRELRVPAGIDFASNDYLGYAGRRRVTPPQGEFSTSGKSSRLLSGHHPIWEDVESRLAHWHGTEAALVFTSGYAANEGLLSTVIGPRDWVASDRLNHACIGDGLRLAGVKPFKFRHNDLGHLEEGLREAARNRDAKQELFIVTESLFSMDGDFSPLIEMVELAERFSANVIVDEAHGTGCYGPTGAGIVEQLGLGNQVLATVHTGGKALGVPGAYVAASRRLIELLVNRCRHFIFTSALPPAVGEWWQAMLNRVPSDTEGRAKLMANLARFGAKSPICPVIIGGDVEASEVANRLQSQGFDVRVVRPPAVPEGTARLRLSIHADHSFDQLDSLAQAIREVLR